MNGTLVFLSHGAMGVMEGCVLGQDFVCIDRVRTKH
mgnify:CR=1 FL=1